MVSTTIEIVELDPNECLAQEERQLSHRTSRDINTSENPTNEIAMYSLEINPEEFPDGGYEAYLVLFGSFCGLIPVFGIPNSMGAIETYVSKNQLDGYKPSTVSWIFSLYLGTMCFCGVFSGAIFDKYGAKKLLMVGTAFMFIGLMSLAELTKLYQFILSFGILTALGTSLAMAPLIGVVPHWFLKKRAMACSIVTIGGLVGSAVFVVMLESVYKLLGYKWAIRFLAFLCVVCMIVANVLVKGRTLELVDLGDSGSDIADKAETSSTSYNSGTINLVAEDAITKRSNYWIKFLQPVFSGLAPLRDIRFVSLAAGVILAELNSMTILTYLASFALAGGVPEKKSYLLIKIVNVSGIPARLVTGILADRYGRFNVMLLTSILSAIFIWAILMPSEGQLPYLYAFAVLYGILNSAVFSLVAACLSQICPANLFGRHYGLLYFCLAFLIVLGVFITSLVINNGSQHDYKMWIIFEGSVSLGSMAAWVWARWCNVKFRPCKF